MNALANSQMDELAKFIGQVPGERPVTFARYTGQEDMEERKRVADHPPDILLTNFMMLELLMTRQEEIDRRVIGNCAGLRFLVLDELHTYRGRQGADVALLVRRVRERLQPEGLVCIGTSATMASEGSVEHKNRRSSRAWLRSSSGRASPRTTSSPRRLSASPIRRPPQTRSSRSSAQAIDTGTPPDIPDSALREHPLAVWVETRLGISFSEVDQRWVRAKPKTMTEAVAALAEESGRPRDACRTVLRDFLLVSSETEASRTGNPAASEKSFFAFKLHQFISGAGHAYGTIEPPGERSVTVDGQQFLPGQPDKRLYAVHFCRECGHEYHPVRLVHGAEGPMFLARDIDDAPPAVKDEADGDPIETRPEGLFGFLTPRAARRSRLSRSMTATTTIPRRGWSSTRTENSRLRKYYRNARAQPS